MVFLTFFGETRSEVSRKPGNRMTIPLVTLAVLSVIGGYIEIPDTLGNLPIFSNFMKTVLPVTNIIHGQGGSELLLQILSGLASLGGIAVAYLLFLRTRDVVDSIMRTTPGSLLHRFWFSGWGFDWIYDTFLVRPFIWITRVNREDFFDLFNMGIAWYNQVFHGLLSSTQSGKVRWYAMGITLGAIIGIAIVVFS
jgi:NADH-quinone oxidoreductase subunit L